MTSSDPDWDLIQDIFAKGIYLDQVARRALLSEHQCGPTVCEELNGLWASCNESSFFGLKSLVDGFREQAEDLLATIAEDEIDDLTGQQIGPYLLEKELGRGGTGAVYLARRADDELEMTVCVKVLHAELSTPQMLERFRFERQILASLKHANIAVLHDAGTTEAGRPYFIMEHISGWTADRWCLETGPSLNTLLHLMRKVVLAVGEAHERGIIHRDIKPHNLMVTARGEPKLLDFGIARIIDPLESSPVDFAMTPAYAAPEQLAGKPVGEPTDIYALGLVLLQLLTGSPPNRQGCQPIEAITRLITEGRRLTTDPDASPRASSDLPTADYLETLPKPQKADDARSGGTAKADDVTVENQRAEAPPADVSSEDDVTVDNKRAEASQTDVPPQDDSATDGNERTEVPPPGTTAEEDDSATDGNERIEVPPPGTTAEEDDSATDGNERTEVPPPGTTTEEDDSATDGNERTDKPFVPKEEHDEQELDDYFEYEPVPEALGYVLRKMLAIDPNHRYPNTRALITGLDRVLAGLPRSGDQEPVKKQFDVLFWHHPNDLESVQQLADYLSNEAELTIWRQTPENSGEMARGPVGSIADVALSQSRTCLICLGRGSGETRPPWKHDPIMRDNLAFHADGLRLFPILLPGAIYPEKQSTLPAFLRDLAWRRFEVGFDETGLNRLAEAIRGIRYEEQAGQLDVYKNPFRGLEVFREQDRALFFGRESITQRIAERLTAHNFLAVLGPSGSGKSSIVQAGVIPHLRESGRAVALFTPTRNPLEQLAFALQELSGNTDPHEIETLFDRLWLSHDALHFIADEYLEAREEQQLCIVIDQFEEIFTLTEKESELTRFINALCFAIDQPERRVTVLLTMRSDFLGKCIVFPDLNKYIADFLIQVEPMTREELTRAIDSPARLAGLVLEPGLLERVLDDVAGSSGELPLLEHALLELYERRRGNMLTLAAYSEIGGIEGALTRRAEDEFRALDAEDRETLRKMFVLCLIHPGEGAEDSRRRATRDELMAIGGKPGAVEALLQRWSESRLLTGTRDEHRGVDLIDVAHEALIRRWYRIAVWMDDDRETARLLNRLRMAARTWQESECNPDHLLRGAPLYQMKELVSAERDHLTMLEKVFVQAGIELAEREIRTKEAVTRSLRKRRNLALTGAVISLILAIYSFFMFFRATQETARAEAATVEARTAQTRAEEQVLLQNYNMAEMYTARAENMLDQELPEQAFLYALAALKQKIPADRSLERTVGLFAMPAMKNATRLLWTSPVDHGVNRAAFSGDGRYLAMAGRDATIRLIDRETGGPAGILIGHTNQIMDMVFWGLGQHRPFVVSASADGQVHVWPVPDGFWDTVSPAMSLPHDEPAFELALSPNGYRLASLTLKGRLRIWRINEEGQLEGPEPMATWQVPAEQVTAMSFTRDSRRVAIGTKKGEVLLIDPQTGEPVETWDGPNGMITDMSLAAKALMTTHANGVLTLWPANGRPALYKPETNLPLVAFVMTPDHRGFALDTDGNLHFRKFSEGKWKTLRTGITRGQDPNMGSSRPHLTLSPDGSRLGIIGDRFEIWDTKTLQPIAVPTGHRYPVYTVAVSPDGQTLASGSYRNIILWDLKTGAMKTALTGHTKTILKVAFSPDGRYLASGAMDKTAKIWQLETNSVVHTISDSYDIRDLTFSLDGRQLATASATVKLWDVKTGSMVADLSVAGEGADKLAYSPDGKTLITASSDRSIKVWDLKSNRVIRTLLKQAGTPSHLAYAPDGSLLAVVLSDQDIQLWSMNTGKQVATLQGHSTEVSEIAFSPDSRLLASGSMDQTVKLWNLESYKEITTFRSHHGQVSGLAFTPDGSRLVSGSSDQTIKLWDLENIRRPGVIQAHLQRINSIDISPDGETLASCSRDGSIKLWNLENAQPTTLWSGSPWIHDVAFSPDGRHLAAAFIDMNVKLWDLKTRELILTLPHSGQVYDVAFSPTQDLLASSTYDRIANLWNLQNVQRKSLLAGHLGMVRNIAFSPDGCQLASGSQDIFLWESDTGKPQKILPDHSGYINDLAYSPDGKSLVSASADRSIKIWDLENGKPVLDFDGLSGEILEVAYSPDGNTIASSSSDGLICLWEVSSEKNKPLVSIKAGVTHDLEFSGDGEVLFLAHSNGAIYLWDMVNLQAFLNTKWHEPLAYDFYQAALSYFGFRESGLRFVKEYPFGITENTPDLVGTNSDHHDLYQRIRDNLLILWLLKLK